MTGEFLVGILGISAVAATVIAAGVSFIFKRSFDAIIKTQIEAHVEKIRTDNAVQLEKIRSDNAKALVYANVLVQNQAEHCSGLGEITTKSRKIARELIQELPIFDDDKFSLYRDLAMDYMNKLDAARVFLPASSYSNLHKHKGHMQQFAFDYNRMTGGNARPALIDSLNNEFNEINLLCDAIVSSRNR